MKTTNRSKKVKFIPMKQGKHELFLFTMAADELWERVKINRKEEDKDTGYQRTLSRSRVNAIAKYVREGNPIPLSVLLSLDSKVKVDRDAQTLTFPASSDVGWVIDGQHRLAGMHQADTKMNIGVVAFLGLETEEQIQQFVVINREGKGVPSSLYYDLLKALPQKKTDAELSKERAADIATILKRDESSTFFNRIVVVTAPKQGQLSLTNFVRKVAPLVQPNKGKFEIYTELEQRSIIDNYYHGIRQVFPKEFNAPNSVFFRTIGFGAMMNALSTVFDFSLKYQKGFQIKDVAEVLKKVDYFDFGAWNKLGTGNAAEILAGDDFKEEVRGNFVDATDVTSIRL